MKDNSKTSYIINTAIVRGDGCDHDPPHNTSTVITEIHVKESERVCVIVPKVVASCQSRECFKDIRIAIPSYTKFKDIKFCIGQASNKVITPLSHRKDYARVEYCVTIPYVIELIDTQGIISKVDGNLPLIRKDIIMYQRKACSEFNLTLHVDTRSKLLSLSVIKNSSLIISVGSFVITYMTAPVQLQIPSFGYCLETSFCEELRQPKCPS